MILGHIHLINSKVKLLPRKNAENKDKGTLDGPQQGNLVCLRFAFVWAGIAAICVCDCVAILRCQKTRPRLDLKDFKGTRDKGMLSRALTKT